MYQWIVFVHIVAAMAWFGGMLFLALVIVPVLRGESRELRLRMMDRAGRRFRTVGWIALGLLLVTGVWNLHNRGIPWSVITSSELFAGRFGHILAAKLVLVALVLAISGVHDFVIGPRATRISQNTTASQSAATLERLRKTASWIGRINALLALLIIGLAVTLVRGWPW